LGKEDKDNYSFIQRTIENLKAVGVKSTQIIVTVTTEEQKELAMQHCLPHGVLSQNIIQLDPNLGYPGNMVYAGDFVYGMDPDGVVVNTPADQYVVGENFATTVKTAVESAVDGDAVIVGVKIGDIVTAMGCGHAIYDEDGGPCYKVTGFVEKPDAKLADKIMRESNSACNTGINVWRAGLICSKFPSYSDYFGIDTDTFLKRIGDLKVAVGTFMWYDCGTLESLYMISRKTPNHKNASIGIGDSVRVGCRRSLFYAGEGMELHANGCEDVAVVFSVINEKPIVVVAKRSESQKIKFLAGDYYRHEGILEDDFSMGARNNMILCSNVSEELIVGFVGVENYAVYVERDRDGKLTAIVSQQLTHS